MPVVAWKQTDITHSLRDIGNFVMTKNNLDIEKAKGRASFKTQQTELTR